MNIKSPIDPATIEKLTTGAQVLISGVIYCVRDTAHHRLIQALDKAEKLPFELKGQTIYYAGPSPTRPGCVTGSAGPTTSGRMDIYTPRLIAAGLRAMIGKGSRSTEVREAIKKHLAVYFATTGGAGALLARSVKKTEIIGYKDLGAEAIRKLEVVNFPAIVVNDIYGQDLYEQGKLKYRREEG